MTDSDRAALVHRIVLAMGDSGKSYWIMDEELSISGLTQDDLCRSDSDRDSIRTRYEKLKRKNSFGLSGLLARTEWLDGVLAESLPIWRPMATAPRDGTGILVAFEAGYIDVVEWERSRKQWMSGIIAWSESIFIGWMPLPAPPAGKVEESKT